MATDDFDVGQHSAGPYQQSELNWNDDLSLDHQRRSAGQFVERRVDASFDRALDRHHRALGAAGTNRVHRGRDSRIGHWFVLVGPAQGADRLLAEGAARSQKGTLGHVRLAGIESPAGHAAASRLRPPVRPGQSQMIASTKITASASGVTAVRTTVSNQPRPAGNGIPLAGR